MRPGEYVEYTVDLLQVIDADLRRAMGQRFREILLGAHLRPTVYLVTPASWLPFPVPTDCARVAE